MAETTTKTTKTVTVEKRGGFHDDSFFKDSWDSWDQAMKDVVQKWDTDIPSSNLSNSTNTTRKTTTSTVSSIPASETHNVYRQIRSSNVTSDESQAVSCTEEDDKFKMVIDVKDFKPEHINVKVVDDKIVVEGKIEKKEGTSVSTQQFVRRFLLPPNVDFARISSALSKDGVLKINAPKLANSRPAITTTTRSTLSSSTLPTNPTNAREVTTFTTSVPDRRGIVSTQREDWSSSFDDMVEKSQREMQDMMSRHTLHTSVDAPAPPSSTPTSIVVAPPRGAVTTKDIIRKGDTITEREEKRWEDTPAPGVKRQHHAVTEVSKLKGSDGTVLGNQERRKQESEASGGYEEILPDGTKRKTFTKNYETRQVFTSSSSHPKAL
ncbi:Alpha crystallin/Hsp20 domain [Trinorchestia longiramus]|nr:Alpha crystallin/Hsp20 domain [Trinorchestia longiramus]